MDQLGWCGKTLDRAKRGHLQALMEQTKLAEGLMSVRFWGVITNEADDYYICYGVLKVFCGVPIKNWYVARAAGEGPGGKVFVSLQKLPALKPMHHEALKTFDNTKFTGNLEEMLDGLEGGPGEEEGDAWTETWRLARTLYLMDQDLTTVPVGAYTVDAAHQVSENRTFRGLSPMLASKLSSYVHFREPNVAARKQVLKSAGLVSSSAFLDPLSEDEPEGVWSLQMSMNMQTATLRSLLWPGYFFYHNVGTGDYGGAYFGDGRKNKSLLFMI